MILRLTSKRHHQPFPCGSLGWAALRSRALSRSGTNQAHKLALEFTLTDYPSAYRKKTKKWQLDVSLSLTSAAALRAAADKLTPLI